MAKRIRQLAAAAAAVIVVTSGIAVGFAATARAENEISCQANAPMSPEPLCTVAVTLTGVTYINVQVTWNPQASWITGGFGFSGSCTQNGQKATIPQGSANGQTPFTAGIQLPFAGPATCTVSITAGVSGNSSYSLQANFIIMHVFTDGQQPSTSPSPSASSAPPASAGLVRGYGGKCLNDAGGSAADRAKIQIWSCHQSSAAEQWTYSKDELARKSMCVNAKGTAKNGAPVILWSCTGTANELWIHQSDGEYVLKAGNSKLCLTDPGHSTQNGTQLTVTTCTNAADQHWTLP
jgi:ricin-type beta-trefoil lectin protein